MRITDLDIRCCRHDAPADGSIAMRDQVEVNALDFLVYTLQTDTGRSASMFGFAGRSALGAGHTAASSLRPFLIGPNPLDREQIWHDWRRTDRWWHHLPIYMFGPVDCCLWLLGAQLADQPLWRYIGGTKSSVPIYASSLVLPDAAAYAKEAQAINAAGFKAYKIHPPGQSLDEDIDIHRAVREAVGPEFALMSDPVAPYSLEQSIRLGRELEKLDYLWLEEPMPDENFSALRELTRVLDIPVVGTEVLAKHPYSVAECVATRSVDAVRADASWSGGVTGVLKTAHLAESFHMQCELHWPMDKFDFGLESPLPISDGIATLPTGAGLGVDLDWDMIEDATLEVV